MGAYNTATRLFGAVGKLSQTDLNQSRADILADAAKNPLNIAGSPQFYSDQGARITKHAERALFGAAAANPGRGNRDVGPRDWLSDVMGSYGSGVGPWATWGAQTASIARFGSIGLLGASRSSDARARAGVLGYMPASIGIASWGVNDDTVNPTTTNAWAYYGEAWRMPGVNYQPTFCMELEVVNFGGENPAIPNPYRVNVGGGTVGIQMGAGGGQTSGTFNASSVFTTVANPNQWQAGFLFGHDAHAGVTVKGVNGATQDGDGYAEVIGMARGHAIAWHTPETRANVPGIDNGLFIRSTVLAAVNGTRWEAQDSGMVISNSKGQAIFAAGTDSGDVTSFLSTFGGTGTNPAGINVYGANHDLYVSTNGSGNIRVNGSAVYHEGNPPPASSNPLAGAWTQTTPTPTASSGTMTSASAVVRTKKAGQTVFFSIKVTIANNGTGAGVVLVPVPNAAVLDEAFGGRETTATYKALAGTIGQGGSSIAITNYDGGYPGVNGATLVMSGCYEAA